tara:strand:+ start:419 stop:1342 length:924 start_codon:yes stop_codon:yes gene_type:complete
MTLTKPIKVLLLIVFILILGIVGWNFYKNYRMQNGNPVSGLKPKVEMGIGHITNLTDSTVDVSLNLLIHNPLPIGFDFEGFDYFVLMNGVKIVENNHRKPVALKANDSTVVALPTQLKIKNLSNEGDEEAAMGEDSADYHFEAVFFLKKPFLGKDSLVLAVDKRMPLYRLPKVEMVGYDVEKFRLSKSEIVLQLKFTNRNTFPVQFKNPSYVVDLGKQKGFAKGSVAGNTHVKEKSSEIYEIPLEVDMGKTVKAALEVIFKGKDVPYTLYFKSKLASDNDIFKDSDVNLVVDGEVKDLDTMKKNLGK